MSNVISTNKTALAIKNQLEKNKQAIIKSLPKGFSYERMCRSVINAISTNQSLSECTASSLFLGIIKGFSLGLEPNGALNEGYLVPFKNNNNGIKEAVFMVSYRGLINLARRSGEISSIYAREVCENDEFEVLEGLERKLIHKPKVFGDRGKVIGYYAVVASKNGDSDFEIMTMSDIQKIRNSSRAPNSPAWHEWFDEMAKKSVIKRLLKRAPMSIELAGAIEQENKALDGTNDVIEIEGLDVSELQEKSTIETGEIKGIKKQKPSKNEENDEFANFLEEKGE